MQAPLFIIGAPRSGTTLLLDLLSAHPDFAWISRHLDRDPNNFAEARRNRFFDLPVVGDALFRRRYQINRLPHPVEPWNFWNTHLPGFRRSGEIPHAPQPEDIAADRLKALPGVVDRILEQQQREVLLSKYTDFPRVRLLRAALPHARFVHLVRDPHAVASSYAKRAERGDFSEWKEKEIWKQALPQRRRVQGVAKTPLNLCGALTRWFVDLIREELAELPTSDWVEVPYRDLTDNPQVVCGSILRHFGIPSRDRLTQYIAARDVGNMDHKWREEHDELAQAELDRILNGNL